jgi:hypothetical protein
MNSCLHGQRVNSEMLTELAKQLNISQSAHVNPTHFLALEAWKDILDILDFMFFDGVRIVLDQMDNRLVTSLFRRRDQRGRRSAGRMVS